MVVYELVDLWLELDHIVAVDVGVGLLGVHILGPVVLVVVVPLGHVVVVAGGDGGGIGGAKGGGHHGHGAGCSGVVFQTGR